MSLFTLRGPLSNIQRIALEIGGFLFLLLIWYIVTMGEDPIMRAGIFPSPGKVLAAFGSLYHENELIKNTCLSIGLNLSGYLEAILIALPIGFLIGLLPFFRGAFQRQVDAVRYIPLTGVTGLFILWFGLGTGMKVHFLAVGILIYLLPVIVQRIDEVKEVYLKTVYTLGATNWQTIRSVYIPSVISRLSDDIRVLTAISWTYIIIAESIGSEGGIGALIWRVGQRQGRVDKVFALLAIIIIIGVIQDRIFVYLDKEFFPYKYQQKNKYAKESSSAFSAIWDFATSILVWVLLGVFVLLFLNEFIPIIGDFKPLTYLFGDTVNVIYIIGFSVLSYKLYKFFNRTKAKEPIAKKKKIVVVDEMTKPEIKSEKAPKSTEKKKEEKKDDDANNDVSNNE